MSRKRRGKDQKLSLPPISKARTWKVAICSPYGCQVLGGFQSNPIDCNSGAIYSCAVSGSSFNPTDTDSWLGAFLFFPYSRPKLLSSVSYSLKCLRAMCIHCTLSGVAPGVAWRTQWACVLVGSHQGEFSESTQEFSAAPEECCHARPLMTFSWAQVAEPSDKGLRTHLMCIQGDSLASMSDALPLPSSGRQVPELPEGRKVGVSGETEAGESTAGPTARVWTWVRLAHPQEEGEDKRWSRRGLQS